MQHRFYLNAKGGFQMMLNFIAHKIYKVSHIQFMLLNSFSASPGGSKVIQADSAFEEYPAWLEDLERKCFFFFLNNIDIDLKHSFMSFIHFSFLAYKNLNAYEV